MELELVSLLDDKEGMWTSVQTNLIFNGNFTYMVNALSIIVLGNSICFLACCVVPILAQAEQCTAPERILAVSNDEGVYLYTKDNKIIPPVLAG